MNKLFNKNNDDIDSLFYSKCYKDFSQKPYNVYGEKENRLKSYNHFKQLYPDFDLKVYKLNNKDLSVTFTLQQILVVSVTILIWLTAPLFAAKYNLGLQGTWLLRVFSLSLFLTSLKTIPSILLERKLQFKRLIWPEVVEVISFQVIAVVLASWRAPVAAAIFIILFDIYWLFKTIYFCCNFFNPVLVYLDIFTISIN